MTMTSLLLSMFWIVVLLFIWVMFTGKNPLGREDDLWTAHELCQLIAQALGVSTDEVTRMWGTPQQHKALAQRSADLIQGVERSWQLQDDDPDKIEVTVRVQWRSGQQTSFKGVPSWSDLPQPVRAHFISNSTPIALSLNLPFKSPAH